MAKIPNIRYISDKEFDINLISLDSNNNITLCLNGSNADTQNIIFNTYQYYQEVQKYTKFVTSMIDVDLFDKSRGITSFVMKHIEQIVGKEENKKEKSIKKEVFVSDSNTQFKYVISVLEKLNVSICDKSVLKSIVMKICQFILLNDDVYAYTKKIIIDNMLTYINFSNELWNLLTRDVHGDKICTHDEKQYVFNTLVHIYIDIFNVLITQQQWNIIDLELSDTNLSMLDNISQDVVQEFINSPLVVSDRFKEISGDILEHVDRYFILDIYGQEFVPLQMQKYITWIPQRSEEWKKIYKTLNPPATIINHDTYALFRGALGELLILKYFNFESVLGIDILKIMVGFLHDSDNFDDDVCHKRIFNMCAPDLLILKENKFIPVEIKCLPMKPTIDITNRTYYRELKTAKKQLSYYKQIIDKIYDEPVSQGLLIFMFIETDKISTQWLLIDM